MHYIQASIMILLVSLANIVTASDEDFFSDFQGNARNIESYMGDNNWLVLIIWASDCPVCNQEAESYAHLHELYKNIRVLGLSIDGMSKKTNAEDFIESHDLPFPNLISEPADIKMYYQAQTVSKFAGTPTVLVFDPDGQLMAARAGAVPTKVIQDFIASKSTAGKIH